MSVYEVISTSDKGKKEIIMSIPNCTNFSQYCSIEDSFYAYIPSLAANLAFVAIFGLSLLLHLGQGLWWWKPWKGFAIAMVVGNVGEFFCYVSFCLREVLRNG